MPSVIDLDTLREMLAQAERSAVERDARAALMRAEFAEATAVGRPPLFSELAAKISDEEAACYRKHANVLKRVIAYHSGEIFPGEVAEGLDRSQDHARPITAVTSGQPAKYDVSWQVAMAALETIANPVFGIGFNGLRRIAKKGLRDAKSALKPAPSEVAA